MSNNLNNGGFGLTACSNKAGLTVGGTSTKVKIATPDGTSGVCYSIDGINYYKADTDNLVLTAASAQAAGTDCLYLICLDSSGTLSSVKGTEVDSDDLSNDVTVLQWPAPDDDTCPIGAVRVTTGSSTTFTAGTTALDAAGITDTYYDLKTIPSEPIRT